MVSVGPYPLMNRHPFPQRLGYIPETRLPGGDNRLQGREIAGFEYRQERGRQGDDRYGLLLQYLLQPLTGHQFFLGSHDQGRTGDKGWENLGH